jgi:zinc transporter ZupT
MIFPPVTLGFVVGVVSVSGGAFIIPLDFLFHPHPDGAIAAAPTAESSRIFLKVLIHPPR